MNLNEIKIYTVVVHGSRWDERIDYVTLDLEKAKEATAFIQSEGTLKKNISIDVWIDGNLTDEQIKF